MKNTASIKSENISSPKFKIKSYAPTEKRDETVSLIKSIEETLNDSQYDKSKDSDNKFDPHNFISTKTSVIIDEHNKMNTQKYLEIYSMTNKEFKYTERHSIGKKFVAGPLM